MISNVLQTNRKADIGKGDTTIKSTRFYNTQAFGKLYFQKILTVTKCLFPNIKQTIVEYNLKKTTAIKSFSSYIF